jgi:hypothetical protein
MELILCKRMKKGVDVSMFRFIQNEKKFAHKLSIECFRVNKSRKYFFTIRPLTFSFQDTRHRQTVQAIK